jgi:hypothetical protein
MTLVEGAVSPLRTRLLSFGRQCFILGAFDLELDVVTERTFVRQKDNQEGFPAHQRFLRYVRSSPVPNLIQLCLPNDASRDFVRDAG